MKLFFILILYLGETNDHICKKYENKKHFQFDFDLFKRTFDTNKKNKINIIDINENQNHEKQKEELQNKLNQFRFKKFKIFNEGRRPIIKYNEELIKLRKAQIRKKFGNSRTLLNKLDKINKIIEKTIQFYKNLWTIYTDSVYARIHLNNKFFFSNSLKNILEIFPLNKKIEDEFDYYLFVDFEYNKNENYTAYNIPKFTKVFFESRPLFAYIKINAFYLTEGEVKYDEMMTVVHEILHSFFLVDDKVVDFAMNKIRAMDPIDSIRNYFREYNDFYKLYLFLITKNKLHELYNYTSHFNPDYLYNDVMQPTKVYINHFTFISAGLFEIMTNNTIRINKKLLRNNYETCEPLLEELFLNDNCENSNGNYIKSIYNKKIIKLNNKCKTDGEHFCNSTFQYKKFCNYRDNSENPNCFNAETYKDSNCFDTSNYKYEQNGFFKEYYGKKSNCFEVKGRKVFPYCLKNDVDFKNNKIKIYIEDNEYICNYIKKANYYESINEDIGIKKDNFFAFLKCPDFNRFYLNNLPNWCDNDCHLNGKCIGINKCECYDGFDPSTNCKYNI